MFIYYNIYQTCPMNNVQRGGNNLIQVSIQSKRCDPWRLQWSKFDPHSIMTCVLTTRSIHHFGVIPEAALLPEKASITGAPMLSTMSDPHSEDLSVSQGNHDSRSSLIFTFIYVIATGDSQSPPSVTQPHLPPRS